MRVTHECGVVLAKVKVKASADLSAVERARSDAAEFRELRRSWLHAEDAILVAPLQVREKENPVRLNGSADIETGLAPGEERVGIRAVAR